MLTEAQRVRTLEPTYWIARALRLEAEADELEEDSGRIVRALSRDFQSSLLVEALLPQAERDALGTDADADARMIAAGAQAAFMDRFVLDAVGKRIRQMVFLGSGMNSRAFRMDLPPQLTFTEVDAGAVHDAKARVLAEAGMRGRCGVRPVDLDISAGGEAAGQLEGQLQTALTAGRRAGILWVMDLGFGAWSAQAQTAALLAAAELSPEGSTIVGPAPCEEALEALVDQEGFKVNLVSDKQLSKIFSAPVPEGTGMLVAMRGQGGPPRPSRPEAPSGGGGRARELKL